eukprot:scaffold1347_cov350-Pavlova_lutheri.AAC.47
MSTADQPFKAQRKFFKPDLIRRAHGATIPFGCYRQAWPTWRSYRRGSSGKHPFMCRLAVTVKTLTTGNIWRALAAMPGNNNLLWRLHRMHFHLLEI